MKADRRHNTKNCIWLKMLVILFWLFLWQILAWVIGNKILLEGPIGVVKRLFCDLQTLEYYETVGASVARIMGGVFCGVFLAVILGIFSWKNQVLELFCRPVIQFLKAAPITCFVVLLLIWTGSENLAFYIALLVAFPPVYLNLLEGLKQLDEKLMEVAKVYHMPFKNRWNYIYLPGVKSYFTTALGLAVGMAFKAGVAAEIIGTPAFSMGERIYMSKIYLETDGVLSWMLTVILVSFVCEKLVLKVVKMFLDRKVVPAKCKKQEKIAQDINLTVENCKVSYDENVVLENLNAVFEASKVYAITGSSGIGKTTLLKLLWGLKRTEEGLVLGNQVISAGVFQENRLFEEHNAVDNVLATGCCMQKEQIMEALQKILPADCLNKPVKEFSGGMKRRVEIVRAMLSKSPVILMDEPFSGLDEKTKKETMDFINEYRNDKMILFTTHCAGDINGLKAEEFKL